MSIAAISWALGQDISQSSLKFVLVALANYADEQGVCYPSTERLVQDTSQDRKTVLENISTLREFGLLRDTGKRRGPTMRVIVHQIVGLENCDSHYVYKLTDPDTGEFYIGKRSCFGAPESDSYRSLGRWPNKNRKEGKAVVMEILRVLPSSQEAVAFELETIRTQRDNPLLRNEGHRDWGHNPNSPKNGTVPFFRPNSPVFPSKQSQKRDTDPLWNRHITFSTPIVPKGDIEKREWQPTETQLRLGKLFGRKPITRWSEKELKAFRSVEIDEEELQLIESYYGVSIYNPKNDYRRRDLLTLLNNFKGEVDRARKFKPPSLL